MQTKLTKPWMTILKAFESRVKPDTILLPKLQEYPNPLQEKLDLLKNHQVILDTQTMMEVKTRIVWEEYMGATIFRTNP